MRLALSALPRSHIAHSVFVLFFGLALDLLVLLLDFAFVTVVKVLLRLLGNLGSSSSDHSDEESE